MKKLLGILTLVTLMTSCTEQTARLHLVGNKEPVIIETEWTGYEVGDTVMLSKGMYEYNFFLERNYGGQMKDNMTYGTFTRSDSTKGAYGKTYRVAVIEKLLD